MTQPIKATRANQPRCQRCQHPKSFHSKGAKCKALGCVSCESFVAPEEAVGGSA